MIDDALETLSTPRTGGYASYVEKKIAALKVIDLVLLDRPIFGDVRFLAERVKDYKSSNVGDGDIEWQIATRQEALSTLLEGIPEPVEGRKNRSVCFSMLVFSFSRLRRLFPGCWHRLDTTPGLIPPCSIGSVARLHCCGDYRLGFRGFWARWVCSFWADPAAGRKSILERTRLSRNGLKIAVSQGRLSKAQQQAFVVGCDQDRFKKSASYC